MDQSELNGIAQKWLEAISKLQNSPEQPLKIGPLTAKGQQDLSGVLETLASGLKITSPVKTSLHAGGTHLAVLARSLASYLSVSLDVRDVDTIAGLVHANVAQSLLKMLSIEGDEEKTSKASIYHDDVREGFVRVFQMALYKKYDKFAIEGLLAAANKPPVIYVGARGEVGVLYHVCARVGLPVSCIAVIPCSSSPGLCHTMDVDALEKQINDDCNQGKTPLLVISYAGTPLAGHVEDFHALRGVCDRYSMWLHVTGHGLSSLCLQDEKDELKSACLADSCTLYPGTWFGVLSCPMITLHKHPEVIQTNGVPTSTNFPGDDAKLEGGKFPIPGMFWAGLYPHGLPKLLPLSLWVCLQYLGSSALIDTVSYCRSLTKSMITLLDQIPGVTRLYPPSHTAYVVLFKYSGGGQLTLPSSLKALIRPKTKQEQSTAPPPPVPEGSSLEREPDTTTGGSLTAGDSDNPSEEDSAQEQQTGDDEPIVVTIHGMPLAITNMYNVLLSKELQTHFPKLGLATYDMGGKDGVLFRFDPTVSFPEHSTSVDDLERFASDLQVKLETLHPMAQARCLFEVALRGRSNLRWMEFPNIHCVAVLQFVPSGWASKHELVLDEVNELNRLNLDLCQHLGSVIPVFAPFQHGNFTCILIKELPEDKTMFDVLETLLTETKSFEDHKQYLQTMAAQIQEGIKAAQNDLIKEKSKEEEEEGILKYVPIVGSVVGWLYPTSPTGRIGRTFNLSSGKVEDTAKVYKHKLQLVDELGEEQVVPEPENTTEEKETEEAPVKETVEETVPTEVKGPEHDSMQDNSEPNDPEE